VIAPSATHTVASRSRGREAGLTLVELIVSFAVLLVAMAMALAVYDATWDSFKKGETAAEQQQSVRIAVDRIGTDLQMTGFNYNPDGDLNRPDEQIEAAYDTAVVVRADFDASDAGQSTAPEAALAGGAFETVSTGNDEIVVYALAKPDGTRSTASP
jgi:Tfp pilus assembly protein PilW